jgi:RNA polymerase sigma factor (sigma-70 family)
VAGERDQRLADALARLRSDRADAEGWASLYRLLWPLVVATAFRELNGDGQLAQDAAQEAFIRLARYGQFAQFETGSSLRGYLIVVARNTARDVRRATHRRREQPLDGPDSSGVAARGASGQEESELHQQILHALTHLSEDDRDILRLSSGGLTISEIAKKYELPYSAVAVRLHRARRRLRKYLGWTDA